MNRREFAGLATLASLMTLPSDAKAADTITLLPPDHARAYDIGNGEARVLVDAEHSGGKWRLASIRSDAARKTSLHVHLNADEYVYVLDGVLSIWVDGNWRDLLPDAVAIVPRGAQHALGNRSKKSMRYLAAGSPAGFERFFPEIESLARYSPYGSPKFLAQLAQVYTRYDSKLLGPPPQG